MKINEGEPRTIGRAILSERVPSRLDEKTPVIQRILEVLRDEEVVEEVDEMTVRLCLDEAIINAMRHGNGLDETKFVEIDLFADDREWAIRIHDEGEGFEPGDVPDVNDPESLLLEGGRGILLITEFMDEVFYYDGGRGLQLARRKVTFLDKLKQVPRKIVRKVKRIIP